jgi:NAD(P)-dependent dehydrogenase (short-subunit alcohol dehydrogenase family)
MARVLVTGSSDGIGRRTARLLVEGGHRVVLHARDESRAVDARAGVPGAEAVLVGDLASIAQTVDVARQANESGAFDAVIHNAGVGHRESRRVETVDGLPRVLAVNTIAPYLLTALVERPRRLVYLSSGLHRRGDPGLGDLRWTGRDWNALQAYADSKLHDVLLAFAVARLWPDTRANALEPGWVPTKMGGPGAPDDLGVAAASAAWLATGNDSGADVTGRYFHQRSRAEPQPAARKVDVQDGLLAACARITGITLG